jgi:DNA-binding Lrp family transcriptional regulator
MMKSLNKAYVLISCNSGADNYVISNIKSIDSVKEVHGCFGAYDVIAKMESDSEDKLKKAITQRIRKVPKIQATLSLMTYNKNDFFGKTLRDDEKEVLDRHTAQAYIAIHCKRTKEDQVLRDLSNIPEVIEGDIVIGSYDLMCKVVAPTYNDISDIVTKKIRRVENVKATTTLNVIPNR